MSYLVFRLSAGLLLLGFLLVPGLIVLHVWGLWTAVSTVAFGTVTLTLYYARHVWVHGVSIRSAMTSECDMGWQLHPALTVIVGAVFIIGGACIVAVAKPHAGPNAMSALEQSWFGTAFLLWGIGIVGAGLSYWRTRSTGPIG